MLLVSLLANSLYKNHMCHPYLLYNEWFPDIDTHLFKISICYHFNKTMVSKKDSHIEQLYKCAVCSSRSSNAKINLETAIFFLNWFPIFSQNFYNSDLLFFIDFRFNLVSDKIQKFLMEFFRPSQLFKKYLANYQFQLVKTESILAMKMMKKVSLIISVFFHY